jgi:hypothetical protein
MAPKGVIDKFSKNLRTFLWEEGKTNTKKFHLVNWHMVFQPLENGGLSIRYPTLTNISLGVKIPWRLVSEPIYWWKSILISKYFSSPRL